MWRGGYDCDCGLVIIDEYENEQSVPLKKVDNHVFVKGFVAVVKSQLEYENPGDTSVEATFLFPMDDDSAVFHLEAEIDGRRIVSEVQEKTQAKKTYDDAVKNNETAFMMEESETTGDIFRCKLGNLPPKSKAALSFSFVLELQAEADGTLVFTLPTVLNPRYNPKPGEGGAPFNPSVESGFVAVQDLQYSLDFELKVDGGIPIQHVRAVGGSNLHVDESTWTAKLVDHKFDHDLSVEILYQRSAKPFGAFEAGDPAKQAFLQQHVAMVSFFPDFTASEADSDMEFVFVIDRSGSMTGDNIGNAKETLLLLLKSLPLGCTFNIVSFGSDFRLLFADGSQPYTKESLQTALDLQKSMQADMGGTEILRPLKAIYSKKPGGLRQVFLLTDGDVGNTKDVVNLIRDNKDSSRVFAVGIGEGASTALVKGVARAGGGRAVFVKGSDRLQAKVVTLLSQAMQPVARDAEIQWSGLPEGVSVVAQVPQLLPPIFSGERLVAYTVLKGDVSTGQADVSLTCKVDGAEKRFEAKVDIAAGGNDDTMMVHRLAAKAQIKELELKEDPNREFGADFRRYDDDSEEEEEQKVSKDPKDAKKEAKEKIKRDIITLSTCSNIVSRHTAFVGVDPSTRDRNAGKEKEKVVIARRERMFADSCQRSAPMMMCAAPALGAAPRAAPQARSMAFSNEVDGSSLECAEMDADESDEEDEEMVLESANVKSKGLVADGIGGGRLVADGIGGGRLVADGMKSKKKSQSRSRSRSPPPRSSGDPVLDLIDLQEFEGNWSHAKDHFYVVLGLQDGESGVSNPAAAKFCSSTGGTDEKATALAVAWLKVKFASRTAEWSMVVGKAVKWLRAKAGSKDAADKLVAEAEAVIRGG